MSIIGKISHVSLNSIAYYLLEPRIKSGQWDIPVATLNQLRPELDSLFASYKNAREMFREFDVCAACGGTCCTGQFSRFSIFDHVLHLLAGMQDIPEWNYRLHPFKSYSVNRIDTGLCPHLIPGKGCAIVYEQRPSVCIFGVCDTMRALMTPRNKNTLRELRRRMDVFQWKIALVLLFGGMKRSA